MATVHAGNVDRYKRCPLAWFVKHIEHNGGRVPMHAVVALGGGTMAIGNLWHSATSSMAMASLVELAEPTLGRPELILATKRSVAIPVSGRPNLYYSPPSTDATHLGWMRGDEPLGKQYLLTDDHLNGRAIVPDECVYIEWLREAWKPPSLEQFVEVVNTKKG